MDSETHTHPCVPEHEQNVRLKQSRGSTDERQLSVFLFSHSLLERGNNGTQLRERVCIAAVA